LETLELLLSPIDTNKFKVIISAGGEGEVETSLPFSDSEKDWWKTLIKVLETNTNFQSENFKEPGEQDWMVKSGILMPNRSHFHPDKLKKIGQYYKL
jgi:hypothetical protein